MDKVILNANGIGDQSFDLDHAQAILDLGKAVPPRVWSVSENEKNYTLKDGKLVKVTDIEE